MDADNMEEASRALQVALPHLQQLTCLVLANPALDQDVLSAAAQIRSLRRLYASAEWAVLLPGPWQQTLQSLVRVVVWWGGSLVWRFPEVGWAAA